MSAAASKADSFADVFDEYARARTIAEVRTVLLRRVQRLGFVYVALVSHVDPLDPPPGAIMIHNYPDAWVRQFSAEGYQRVDPVFVAATQRTLPFYWNDEDFLDGLDDRQRRILRLGARMGIADGFTVPIKRPGVLPASGSLVPGPDGVDPLSYRIAHSEIMLAHERARDLAGAETPPTIGLTGRERECLVLAARGKTDWEIGRILGLSQRYVHHVIERAKARAGVSTRIQAVVQAFATGELSITEAIRDPIEPD